jgi:hypothetical protein
MNIRHRLARLERAARRHAEPWPGPLCLDDIQEAVQSLLNWARRTGKAPEFIEATAALERAAAVSGIDRAGPAMLKADRVFKAAWETASAARVGRC